MSFSGNALRVEAIRREEAGDLIGAIEANKKIAQLEPRNASALTTIAGLYGLLGMAAFGSSREHYFEEEIIWARKAIDVNPRFSNAYVNLGNALMMLGGRITEAKQAFEKARQLTPDKPYPVYSLGVLEEEQEHFEAARDFYQESIRVDPRYESGYFNLAAMHANLYEFDKAIAALEKLLELNPNDEDAQDMLWDIKRRRGV